MTSFMQGWLSVLIFVLVYLIGRVIGIFMHLVPQPEKLRIASIKLEQVYRCRDNSLGHQMGLTVLSTGSHGFHPK